MPPPESRCRAPGSCRLPWPSGEAPPPAAGRSRGGSRRPTSGCGSDVGSAWRSLSTCKQTKQSMPHRCGLAVIVHLKLAKGWPISFPWIIHVPILKFLKIYCILIYVIPDIEHKQTKIQEQDKSSDVEWRVTARTFVNCAREKLLTILACDNACYLKIFSIISIPTERISIFM